MVIKQKGFSLTELVITIVILAILGVSSIILWPKKTLNLYAEANKVASDIRYVKALSMAFDENYRIDLTQNNSYKLLNASGNPINNFTKPSATIALPPGITIQTNSTDKYLAFDCFGTPYLSASNTTLGTKMASTLLITLMHNSGEQTIISVKQETGYVEVH